MPELETSPSSAEPTSDAVILFTDIVDSLRTQSGIGTDLYAPMLDRHNVLFKGALSAEGGRVLQHTGDGYLAMLEDPAAAVRVALAFQAAIRAERWTSEPLRVRAALAAGKVSLREDPSTGELRAVGIATNIAGRLLGLAMPDQILMTGEVFDAARVAIGEHPPVPGGAPAPEGALEWLAHGPYIMQGIEEPVGVFEAGVAGSAPLCPPEQSDKASRNIRKEEEATLGWRPAAGREVPGRGDWVLAEKLGAGSFGEVWRAENAGAGERRVFKFCFEPERLRSLRREAELVAHIRETLGNRDDIAPLFSAQVERPPFFLEGPFIGGGNLSDWIAAKGGTGEVALEDRLRLFAQVARAVGAAHSVGIIHKDIKPSNILVQEAGGTPQAILADFGIGKLVGGDSQGTLSIGPYSYDAAGARLYMAPEYMTGAAPSVQGDIYALGVLLFQLVTGDLSAPAAQGWERRIGDDILRADIAACIDEDPALRPPSADEVAKRIEALAERRAAAAAEQAAAEKARRARRLRVILAISAGAFAVIAGFLAWLFIAESKHLDEMTAANERNEQLAYGFGLRRAHELIEDRIPAEARKVLEALPERRRSTGWQSLKDRVDPPRQWIALPDSWREPEGDQLMPRGRSVANRDRSLIAMVKNRVITVASMDPVEVVAPELVHPAEVTNCAFLPQADYLLSLDVGSADSPPRVWGWRIGEWKPVDLITLDVELPDAQLRNPLDLVVGNSGKNVVVVYDGKLVGYQVIGGGGKPVSLEQKYEKETSNSDLILNGVHNGTAVSAAAEADLFVAPRRVGGGKKVMHAYRMSDGALTAVFDRGTDEEDYGFYDSQITADGNFISAIATKFTVLIDNRDRENPKKRFRSLGNNDTSFSGEFSPDGRIYMEINAAGYLRFWDPVTAEVVSRIEVPGAGSARRGAFSPDGSMVGITFRPDRIQFRDVVSGKEIAEYSEGFFGKDAPVFGAGGKTFAMLSRDGRILSGRLGEPGVTMMRGLSLPLIGDRNGMFGAAFDPAGERVGIAIEREFALVFDLRTGDIRRLNFTDFGSEGMGGGCAFSLDGRYFAASTRDKRLAVWDSDNWSARPASVAFEELNPARLLFGKAADGSNVLAAMLTSHDLGLPGAKPGAAAFKILPAEDGETPLRLEKLYEFDGAGDQVELMAEMSRSGRYLATATHDWAKDVGGAVEIRDAGTGTVAHRLPGHTNPHRSYQFSGIAFNSEDRMVIAADNSKGGHFAAVVTTLGAPGVAGELKPVRLPHPAEIKSVGFDRELPEIAVTACADGRVRVWDVAKAEELRSFKVDGELKRARLAAGGIIHTMSKRRDAKGNGAHYEWWDAETGARLWSMGAARSSHENAFVDPSGERFLVTGWDDHAEVWSIASEGGKEALRGFARRRGDRFGEMKRFFDERTGAFVEEVETGVVKIRNLMGDDIVLNGVGGQPEHYDFSADGRRLAVVVDGKASIWAGNSALRLLPLAGEETYFTAFAPAGTALLHIRKEAGLKRGQISTMDIVAGIQAAGDAGFGFREHDLLSALESWNPGKTPAAMPGRIFQELKRQFGLEESRRFLTEIFPDRDLALPGDIRFLEGPPPAGWSGLDFDASAWASGKAPLGWNGNGNEGIASVIEHRVGCLACYFRCEFDLDLGGVEGVIVEGGFDDGAVIYVNGEEIERHNMPDARTHLTYETLAKEAARDNRESFAFIIPSDLLRNGRNVIAAEIHQNSPTSSDLLFDISTVALPAR